jgi:hypothetical protein
MDVTKMDLSKKEIGFLKNPTQRHSTSLLQSIHLRGNQAISTDLEMTKIVFSNSFCASTGKSVLFDLAENGNASETSQEDLDWLIKSVPDIDSLDLHFSPVDSEILTQALKFVSDKEARFVFNGVLFDGEANKLVSTDGRRLFLANWDVASNFKAIVPQIAIKNALKLKDLKIAFFDEKVVFTGVLSDGKRCFVITKLIDGNFPDYERVIPKRENCPNSFSWTKQMKTDILKLKSYAIKNDSVICLQNGLISVVERGKKDEKILYQSENSSNFDRLQVNFFFMLDMFESDFWGEDDSNPLRSDVKINEIACVQVIMPIKLS